MGFSIGVGSFVIGVVGLEIGVSFSVVGIVGLEASVDVGGLVCMVSRSITLLRRGGLSYTRWSWHLFYVDVLFTRMDEKSSLVKITSY